MTVGGLPTVQVLLDDGTGTFPFDITTYARMVEGITGARGRQDELSQVTAPTPGATLDNQDGRFSFGSTLIASPSPILIDQRVRVKLTANATTVNRYGGTLIAANPTWPGGGDEMSVAAITLADVQAQAERRTLRSVPEEEIMLDSPLAYYLLAEPTGAQSAVDTSGNQQSAFAPAGSGAALVFGTGTGPSTDGHSAVTFAGGQYLWNAAFPILTTAGAFIIAFATTSAASMSLVSFGLTAMNGINLSGGNLSVGNDAFGSGGYNDGKVHTVAVIFNGGLVNTTVYIDGVLAGTGTHGPNATVPGVALGSDGTSPFTGTLAHFASWSTAPSGARMITESQALLTGFAGESGTARISRLAGYAGIPLGTLDASLTNIPFVDITGMTAMAALQAVADAEFGLVFFDGSGNLTFHNRNRAVAKTAPDVTIDANQLDPGTAFFYDSQGILNYLTVTAQGTQVAQVARNTISELGAAGSPKHGRYSDQKTYWVQSDAEALDRGNWIVGRHGQAAPRAGSLVVNLLDLTAAQQASWLAVEPNTWVRITGLPAQTPGGTTADLIVQGWAETLNATTWSLTLNTASRPAFYQAWILDDTTFSVLDSTTRLFI